MNYLHTSLISGVQMWLSSLYPFLFFLVVRHVFLKCRMERACYTVTYSALDSPSTGVSLYAHAPLWALGEMVSRAWMRVNPQTSVTITGVLTMRACCSALPGRAGEGALTVSGRGEAAQRSIDLRKMVFFLHSKHIFMCMNCFRKSQSVSCRWHTSAFSTLALRNQAHQLLLPLRCTVFSPPFLVGDRLSLVKLSSFRWGLI